MTLHDYLCFKFSFSYPRVKAISVKKVLDFRFTLLKNYFKMSEFWLLNENISYNKY